MIETRRLKNVNIFIKTYQYLQATSTFVTKIGENSTNILNCYFSN